MNKLLAIFLAALPVVCMAQDALQNCRDSLASGDYAAAIKSGQQAEGFDGLMCMGRAQSASGDYAGASGTFTQAGKSAREPFEQMLALTFLARASQGLGKSDDALEQYAQSLKIARQIKQRQGQMIDLNESGQILQSRGDLKRALEYFQEGYLNAANDNERAECDHLIAFAHSQLGDHDKAIEYQLKSLMLEERSGDFEHYISAKLDFAEVLMKAKDFVRAQKELDESLPVAQSVSSVYWEAKITLYFSRLKKLQGDNGQAKALLDRARDLAKKSGDADLIQMVSSELIP